MPWHYYLLILLFGDDSEDETPVAPIPVKKFKFFKKVYFINYQKFVVWKPVFRKDGYYNVYIENTLWK